MSNMQREAVVWFGLFLVLLGGYVQCESRKPVLYNPRGRPGTGCFFVVLDKKTTEEEFEAALVTISKLAEDSSVYTVIRKVSKAFTVKLSAYSLELVRRMPLVSYIEEEGFAVGTRTNPEWHLDRLDQREPQLDSRYWPISEGEGVDVFVLDSGISYDHKEFEYRAKYPGLDPVDEYRRSEEDYVRRFGADCHGHGTHVASLCGGRTYGSAKKVTLYSVRVLECTNSGPWSAVISGIEYVVEMAERTNRPTIMSMSFSGDHYTVVDEVVIAALDKGIHIVVAAGNGGDDACSRSPASVSRAITVGGTRQGDGLYSVGTGTNFGACIDIFAPGEAILAADMNCNNCSQRWSGTSMSTPLVSGLAALILSREPLLSPAQLKTRLIEESVKGILNFDDMPSRYRQVTPNRLAITTGSCGERNSVFGSSMFSSPNFPHHYLHNINCKWDIGGEPGIQVNITLFYIDTEPFHDVLKVYDGCCEDPWHLLREFTGHLGEVNFNLTSSGNRLCVQLVTDGTVDGIGFNGTYSKFYSGTDLKVPTVPTVPITTRNSQQSAEDVQVTLLMAPRQARSRIEELMAQHYKLTYISSYRVGPSMVPYFDFVATNSSTVDTVSYVEIGFEKLNESIHQMKQQGYDVRLLIDRIRGKNPSEPSYSVIFERRDPIFETQVFLRDSFSSYTSRLDRMTKEGFRLISHSFCSIRGALEATSVYLRDRRIPLDIPTPNYPELKVSNNLTFFAFTSTTLRLASEGFYPRSVEVFKVGESTNSHFSVIYEKRSENSQGNWFRWSVNTTAAREMIARETAHSWDVYITTGYTYLGNTEHFIEFERKGL